MGAWLVLGAVAGVILLIKAFAGLSGILLPALALWLGLRLLKKMKQDAEEEKKQDRSFGEAKKFFERSKGGPQWAMIVGTVLVCLGLILCAEPIDMLIRMGSIEGRLVRELLTALIMTGGGGAMLLRGFTKNRRYSRYTQYLTVMGDRESVTVQELVLTLGYSQSCVVKDLHRMIGEGYFGGKAYLNVELGRLLRGGSAGESAYRQRQEAQPPAAEPESAAVLRRIREANDRIADPELSEKIGRIEEITAKIFRAVEADPKKRGKIDTFLSYYLPVTQKLLDSYAEFEAAGVEGENLRQAKKRIESTMNAVIQGFEHQLDALYKADALDVDSDIRVLETMLGRDTATVERDFGMGGAAVRTPEERRTDTEAK